MNFKQNNLEKSSSPYLRQHKQNPIHWQEYSAEVVAYAQKSDKPILMSIGYATCHWCHVMASDTFSNIEVADYMNENFVCIKVDREQRPDIDQFCMSFMQKNYGQGGWPLNVVMSPNFEPFFAATYLATGPRHSMPGFIEVMSQVLNFYKENKNSLTEFIPTTNINDSGFSLDLELYKKQFDNENFGFVSNNKFPPHNSLMFLMSHPQATEDQEISSFVKSTLDKMANSGLYDHSGGGFFRYCVDERWEIPHFEKMLYDQAMMLINYSLGYSKFQDRHYLEVISRTLFSLEDTFKIDDCYASGHDADTNHEEGKTYLWEIQELKKVLGNRFEEFEKSYNLIPYEGLNHLTTRTPSLFARELYELRSKRPQPERDSKILTSWNSLLIVAFCFVERFTEIKTPVRDLYKALKQQSRHRSSIDGTLQEEYFLEDAASFFLAQTFLFELGVVDKENLDSQFKEVSIFREEDLWVENPNSDFVEVPPQEFDHPTPSTISILEWALLRYRILKDQTFGELDYKFPINFDAYNLAACFSREHTHVKAQELPKTIDPLLLYEKSAENLICHKGVCRPLTAID